MTEREHARVLTFGETMALVRTAEPGPLRAGARATVSFGGAESNVAIGLRRLGVGTRWRSRLGDDPAGEAVVAALRAEQVEVVADIDPVRPTGLMVKGAVGPGMLRVSYYRAGSAASAMTPSLLDRDQFDGIELLHVSGITPALSADAADLVRQAAGLARERGVRVSFDVNYRSALWSVETARRHLRPLLLGTDVLFGGREELELLCDPQRCPERLDDAELLAAVAAEGPREVVLKRGPDGAALLEDGRWYESPAHAIAPVDTVGAGDAFVAGYLAAALNGAGPMVRLQEANACGALACLSPGDWEGAPARAVLDRFLSTADPVLR